MKNITVDFVKSDFEDDACHTGVTFTFDMLLIEDCTNLPNDLTGYTATLLIFDEVETEVIDTIAGTIAYPLKGKINFTISAATTAGYTPGMYCHHIELTNGTVINRVAEGSFEVSE